MSDRQRVVSVRSLDGYCNRVVNGRGFATTADEPPELGGSGAGFGPYELLAAGLGACTAITLRMYAERKNWPLHNISVDLQYVRAGEQGTDDDGPDLIRRTIVLDGPLDARQRERLVGVAARCPVARSLTRGAVAIVDRLVQQR